jgi:hypothetical protein
MRRIRHNSDNFFFISGVVSSMVSGILFLLGVSILVSWKLPKWPRWIELPVGVLLLPPIAYATYSIFLIPNLNKTSIKIILPILICIFAGIEVAIVGYSILDIPIIEGIPDWPMWAGWVSTIAGFFSLTYGIDRFFQIKV